MRRVSRQQYLTHLLAFFALLLIGMPFFEAAAQTPTYTPLVGIPELVGKENPSLAEYFNQLYLLTIVVGCFIAVLKISFAGVKWALSDVVTDKSSAREDIKGALLGLAILLVPFIVLNTINPNLTNLNILQNAEKVRVDLGKNSNPSAPTQNTPSEVRVDETTKNCTYSATPIDTGEVDMNGATIYTYSYDKTTCLSDCSALQGSFTETTERGGTCSYLVNTDLDGVNNPIPGGPLPGP